MNTRLPCSLLAPLFVLVAACGPEPEPAHAPVNPAPPPAASAAPAPAPGAKNGTEVLLCDGKTKSTFPASTPGDQIASALMNEWLRKNPDAHWETTVRTQHGLEP